MGMVDSDGNLCITYDVTVSCRGKRVLYLGAGLDAVSAFYEIAEKGIPGAKETKYMWAYNVLVTLSGRSLLEMLAEHYPHLLEKARKAVDPEEEYVIDCYDMS